MVDPWMKLRTDGPLQMFEEYLLPQKLTVGMVKWEKWYLEVNKYRKEHTKNKSWMSVSAALLSS